ncbi:MAG: ASPIC/UnbV domain-containing protein, partial [bacterium]
RKSESTVFMDVTKNAGEVFSTEWMARGLVLADFDQDGALDALVQSQGDPLLHLKNVTNTQNNWVSIQLQGRQSNRDGIGARLIWKSGDQPLVYFSTGGGSFQSATSSRIHIGADGSGEKNELEIRWPSGQVDRLQDVKLNAVYKVTEGLSRPEQIKPASQ